MSGKGSKKASKDGKDLANPKSSKKKKSDAGKGLNEHKEESHKGDKKK